MLAAIMCLFMSRLIPRKSVDFKYWAMCFCLQSLPVLDVPVIGTKLLSFQLTIFGQDCFEHGFFYICSVSSSECYQDYRQLPSVMSGLLAPFTGFVSANGGEVIAVVVAGVVAAATVAAGDTAAAVGDDGVFAIGFSGTVPVFFKSCWALSTIFTWCLKSVCLFLFFFKWTRRKKKNLLFFSIWF